jgi:DNA-binding transcriptional LysR family regulator
MALIIKCGIVDAFSSDFNALKVFIAVVERESFVGQRKFLQCRHQTSRCISQLEEKLNLQLIERSTRHMKLTRRGIYSIPERSHYWRRLSKLRQLTLRQMQLKGPLRICIPNEIGPALLGSVMPISPVSIRIWRSAV